MMMKRNHNYTMPKAKPSKPRYLPEWANEPLKFTFSPEVALKTGAFVKLPASRKPTLRAARKSRR
jgi:hypothetical protein